MNKNIDWSHIRAQIERIVAGCEAAISQETKDAVIHYLEHDEYEMAFEGLFIDIMSANIPPEEIGSSRVDLKAMGEELNLNNESVFSGTFWEDFSVYLKSD